MGTPILVDLPGSLIDQVDNLVKDKRSEYSTRAEWIRQAVREKLEETPKRLLVNQIADESTPEELSEILLRLRGKK